MKALFTLLLISFLSLLNAQNNTISGEWLLALKSNDVGYAEFIMNIEAEGNSFIGFTRKNATRDVFGNWNSRLARTFTGDFKKGTLARIVKGTSKVKGDSLIFSAVFGSSIGNYYFKGYIYKGQLNAELLDGRYKYKGAITGTRDTEKLLSDYPKLLEQVFSSTEDKLYDPSLLASKDWKRFKKKMTEVSAKTQNDLEFVFAFFYYARKLPFSHYACYRVLNNTLSTEKSQYVFLEEKSPETAYLKITSFTGSKAEMDSIFSIIISKSYKNLIVDLRNNGGGSVEAGMAFAKSVSQKEYYGGVFLTKKWFENNPKPPTVEQYNQFQLFSESNFDMIIEGIHKTQGLCLKVIPYKEVYKGNIYILTNSNTASTCEPIVYGLKQNGLATIVGETTAGAMLNAEFFNLNTGLNQYPFQLVVPTADYYTSDGNKIDQVGVKPNYKVKSEKALDFVLEELIPEQD